MSREEGVVGKLAPPLVWAWVQAAWPGSVVVAGVVVWVAGVVVGLAAGAGVDVGVWARGPTASRTLEASRMLSEVPPLGPSPTPEVGGVVALGAVVDGVVLPGLVVVVPGLVVAVVGAGAAGPMVHKTGRT